jgi:hypothetical protein
VESRGRGGGAEEGLEEGEDRGEEPEDAKAVTAVFRTSERSAGDRRETRRTG